MIYVDLNSGRYSENRDVVFGNVVEFDVTVENVGKYGVNGTGIHLVTEDIGFLKALRLIKYSGGKNVG